MEASRLDRQSDRRLANDVLWHWYVRMIGAGTLVFLAFLGIWICFGLLKWALGASPSNTEVRQMLAVALDGHEWIPGSLSLQQAEMGGWNDSSDWYRFSIDPAEIDQFKHRLIQTAAQLGCTVDDRDGRRVTNLVGGINPPWWWDPERLDDGDVLSISTSRGWWFVFSKRQGIVYLYFWST
jgi:hypothetical protein